MNVKSFNERELLKQHATLVSSAVNQFTQTAAPICSADHLHGLGLIALLDAARHYPPASEVSFETFARVQIHSALLGEVRRAKKWFTGTPAVETPTMAFA
jgi:DNA-directed RNA polymerase specialized sigma subunit